MMFGSPLYGSSWTEVTTTSVWSARHALTSAVYDDRLWVMGGKGVSFMNDIWFTTDGAVWTEVTTTSVWSARFAHTNAVYDDKLWLMGGNGVSILNDVWFTEESTIPSGQPTYQPTTGISETNFHSKTGSIVGGLWGVGNLVLIAYASAKYIIK